jgi:isoleucyl-tRNA synthetase
MEDISRIEKSDASKREEEILAFWEAERIFEKSLEKEASKGEFTFYDGPPFANGLPHSGSLLASVSKDLIPRYKTMRGYRVRRRWGWDTHGLPIESAVEKKLGLRNKKEILALGVQTFNETARGLVLEYVHEWKKYVGRVGRWVDFDNAYTTMDASFMESVWWALKQLHEKGNLYEGRKVLMYCPHDETPLSKAEITMDSGTYKDITEESATVKFKVKDPTKHGLPENTFLLAWTTTPWTLPGNVALAIGKNIEYGIFQDGALNQFKKDNPKSDSLEPVENYILAKNLASNYSWKFLQHVSDVSSEKLVGISYEPLYELPKVAVFEGKKWEVFSADFVTAEDGTGIVHTAVIYGEDDYALGLREGLPMVPILNPNGTYNDDAPEFLRGQYIKKAEAAIKEDLESRGLLFARALYTHSYPHCYRCGTALIYNAVSSWFINIQNIKEALLSENEKISWTPEHLKHGRFQKNLESAPDWTISRNRFWATPLPIWKDDAGKVTVIGSVEELKERTKKSGNTYYTMRHGESENNVKEIFNTNLEEKDLYHLTDFGKKTVRESSEALKDKGIDLIFVSPFARTMESARIVAEHIGLSEKDIIVDERLVEINVGEFDGRPLNEYRSAYKNIPERFQQKEGVTESFSDVRKRIGDFLYDLEAKYENKNILIVSHGDPLWIMKIAAAGAQAKTLEALPYPMRGNIEVLDFIPLPHNTDYELDFHLPYIDQVHLFDQSGGALTRIPEVVDCWVESGSMPFAEYHYPFENKELFEKRSPADFISEYIGQTRAWFYYLHAMGVGLFGRAAFKNVATTGTILAADGEKVSKSKKNYTDPSVLFDRFSADAFRYYLMSSVVMQAEDLQFRDDEVKEIQNRVVNMLRNVLAFYALFAAEIKDEPAKPSKNLLDAWILSRLAEVIRNAEESFDRYDTPRATRPMRDFIDDLSTWYVRRSRDRVKGADEEDKQHALGTLRFVLKEFSKCIAPVMPFVAEEVFQMVKDASDPQSVHLADWPMAEGIGGVNASLNEEMARVRTLASEALMHRQRLGIKVRQPLGLLSVPGDLSPALAEILKEEVNVKDIAVNASEMSLDTTLTPELIREGDVRDFMRALAEARKEQELTQKDFVALTISTNGEATFRNASLPGVSKITFADDLGESRTITLSFGDVAFALTLDAS